MELDLYEDGEKLEPLEYSSGKTQTEVVGEILEAFESHDLVWLDGKVGSGKSVVGIRTALEIGGGTFSVPTKVLSDQYYEDYYAGDKQFMVYGKIPARISVFKGRGNFKCPYMEDLHPDWEGWKLTCQNRALPCTRALREDEDRVEAVEECPWGGTVQPAGLATEEEGLPFKTIREYRGLQHRWKVLLKKKFGSDSPDFCPYWSQYVGYAKSDVVVMNSAKFEIEAWMGRLPKKPLICIDEADDYLDGICSKVSLSERRVEKLAREIRERGGGGPKSERLTRNVRGIWGDLVNREIGPFKAVASLKGLLEELEWESQMQWDLGKILQFKDQVSCNDKRSAKVNPKVTFYIANPKPILRKLFDKLDAKILMMSATKPKRKVLKSVFGIDPVLVEGEPEFPGTLVRKTTGEEVKVNHDNWTGPDFREKYRETRDSILKRMDRPGFVPVHATKYLPDRIDKLTEENRKEINEISFSTKMNRGVDLGGMKSVALLKYPRPDYSDPLLKAMKKKLGEKKFWTYYRDMARRGFIQQIGRIMRDKDARKEFWSPDSTCHKKLEEAWNGKVKVEKSRNT